MRRTPLADAPRYPVTVVVAAVAVGVSLAFWSGGDVDALFMDAAAFWREPWRLVTAIFPHGDFLHLLFNVIWLWIMGTWLEREHGHAAFAGFLVGTAVVSSAGEYAVSGGGIGLSGVGYAMFGYLWATARFDPRRSDAMDTRTVQLFLAWGLLCIVLTAVGVWNIGNVAHAVGLATGGALGVVRATTGRRRALAALALGVLVVGSALGATALRPWTALADRGAAGHCYAGWRALEADDDERALALLDEAARYPARSPGCVFNHGIALSRAGRLEEAAREYELAIARDPSLGDGVELNGRPDLTTD